MEFETKADVLAESFDIVARLDAQEEAITGLRGDIAEVKGRLDKVSRAAARPVLDGADNAVVVTAEVKGFVEGYLRHGREGIRVRRGEETKLSASFPRVVKVQRRPKKVKGHAGSHLRVVQIP